MKHFTYETPTSFEEAGQILSQAKEGEAAVMAGGTDLLGVLKTELLENYPQKIVALRDIPDTDYIKKENGSVKVGAMTRLEEIEKDEAFDGGLNVVKEAAHSIASPLIRNRGTLGGNLCQDVRCWFYRVPDQTGGILDCMRKGGKQCFAIYGDNRYHSIYGGMKVHATPCSAECPAGTDIPAYVDKLRKGDYDGAARIILRYNAMPSLTSRVCPHPCQKKCNQCEHGDSVNIHGLERSLGDYIMAHADQYYQAPKKETGKKVAVIGAGPGGLSAAYYLRKAGNTVVVYDRMKKPGGVMMYGIPHYRLPKDKVQAFADAIQNMGVTFKMGVNIGEDVTVEELDKEYDALYFGTGAWKQPILGIGGENMTEFGLDFLVEVNTYLKKAIGQDVLVCGGGSVAMDVALTAKRLGAKKVKLVCLEQEWEMPATPEDVARAKEEGVEMHNGWGLSKVLTDENGKVRGLESMKCVSVRDETGRFNPKYDYNEMAEFESDYIILATGQRVDISFLGDKFSSQLKSKRGLIDADLETLKTKNPKIYAGGDVVTGPNIAIRAIRAGRVAAENINKDFGLAPEPLPVQEGFLHFDPSIVRTRKMHALAERPISERTLTDEDTSSFDAETTAEEAGRCMNCGCYSVNASDLSPVMVMTDATIVTTKDRRIPAAEFFCTKLKAYANLEPGELIKFVEIPEMEGWQTGYKKMRLRPSIDFAIVSLAWGAKMKGGVIDDVRLVLGAVAPVPLRLEKVEAYLKGKTPSAEVAEKAAEMAVEGAQGIGENDYKIDEVKTYVRRMVEALA
jgi:NADPH-dependent glutamate synthase beta subunit-like oxidoreductase/CO/xanthine dehydrogenase FAD-binding subunit